jgi:lipopolysaccharide/colanic/teichoic acid biosynthesis glycosyltransferase
MKHYNRFFSGILIFIDILAFYSSVILLVLVRYGFDFLNLEVHLKAFTFILPFWLLVFYSNNLYSLYSSQKFSVRIIRSFIAGIIISVLFFYFSPSLKITPKTNLALFSFFFLSLFLISRLVFLDYFLPKNKLKILFIVPKELKEKIEEDIKNLEIFEIVEILEKIPDDEKYYHQNTDLVVISRKIYINHQLKNIIEKFGFKVPIMELIDFYERYLNRIPIEEIDEYWILKEIINPENSLQVLIKRILDIIFALIIGVLSLPLLPFIILGIYISSPGPVIFKQKRIGKDNKEFVLYKFRTMKNLKDLGIWAKENDERIFLFGKILRRLHLDEIPQIINILKGELSFIGPRPEQVHIVQELAQKIPFFNIRHIIPPGITGWAQVNYKYARSVEESKIKFEYDLYYLKNRNIFLDILIFFKTIFNI